MKRLGERLSLSSMADRGSFCESPDMPNQVKKSDLPEKVCAACGRPFTWRKKWEKVWDEVRYCSDKCRANKKAPDRK